MVDIKNCLNYKQKDINKIKTQGYSLGFLLVVNLEIKNPPVVVMMTTRGGVRFTYSFSRRDNDLDQTHT